MGHPLGKVKQVEIEAQDLRVHPRAQREIERAHLRKISETLDLDAIGTLCAVEYPVAGTPGIYLIDGQHRLRALIDNGLGEWPVRVDIFVDVKDDRRAAELFLRLNNRRSVTPYATFTNEVLANDPAAVSIVKAADKNGFRIEKAAGDGKIIAVAALKRVYAGGALDETLRVVASAWGHTAPAVEGHLLEGLGLVLASYNGAVDRSSLIQKLAKFPGGPNALLGSAKGLRDLRRTSLSRCVASVVVDTYNKGRSAGRIDPL